MTPPSSEGGTVEGQREALWGKVPSEVKLLRNEVAFGNEAAYGCEVASQ